MGPERFPGSGPSSAVATAAPAAATSVPRPDRPRGESPARPRLSRSSPEPQPRLSRGRAERAGDSEGGPALPVAERRRGGTGRDGTGRHGKGKEETGSAGGRRRRRPGPAAPPAAGRARPAQPGVLSARFGSRLPPLPGPGTDRADTERLPGAALLGL